MIRVLCPLALALICAWVLWLHFLQILLFSNVMTLPLNWFPKIPHNIYNLIFNIESGLHMQMLLKVIVL